jgi:hypothetical protein
VVAVASLIIFSACGNNDSSELATSTTSVREIATDGDESEQLDNDGGVGSDECATALAAFSAVSNILMSGLAKPSSFEVDRYTANLEATKDIVTASIQTDFSVYYAGYSDAGSELAVAKRFGTRNSRGADAIDKATAILNDVSVTRAAMRVATFLASDCRTPSE